MPYGMIFTPSLSHAASGGGAGGRAARVDRDAWAACWEDRKSTRLNSSHLGISYAVFCLKKKMDGWDTLDRPPVYGEIQVARLKAGCLRGAAGLHSVDAERWRALAMPQIDLQLAWLNASE